MRRLVGFVGSCAALALFSELAPTNAQCLDWSHRFTSGGLSNAGYAQVVFDDGSGAELYVGGQFTVAGDVIAHGIAKWNGSRWAPLGSGIDAPPAGGVSFVSALGVYDDGSGPALYAGGSFASIGGVAANNIAKWNGTSWSALSSGTNQQVQALIAFDDGSGPALYAAGAFSSAGGTTVRGVARWNGSAWSAVGSICAGSFNVHALEVFDDGSGPKLFAGGAFCFGASANIGKWNGVSWSAVGNGLSCEVFAMEVFDDGSGPALYAGGNDLQFTGQVLNKWNGSSWTTIGSYYGGVRALTVYDDGGGPALYIGGPIGTFTTSPIANGVVRWNGTNNSFVGASTGLEAELGSSLYITSLCAFDDGSGPDLYCTGLVNRADGQVVTNIAHFDAQGWSALSASGGFDGTVTALHEFDDGTGNALYVGGGFASVAGVDALNLARWDGVHWTPLSLPNGAIYSIEDFDDGSGRALCVARAGTTNLARWNGSAWTAIGGLSGKVNALASWDDGSGEALYCGGLITSAGGMTARRIAEWNGATWSTLDGGIDAEVFCLAPLDDGTGTKLFVGGRFMTAGAMDALSIARWNGTTWSDVGGGTDGWVYTFVQFDDGSGPAVFVGGTFNTAGSTPASHVAKWNGSSWSAVGAGTPEFVSQLVVHDDGAGAKLYAAALGGEHLYRLDGATWTSIGQLDHQVHALASFDDGSGTALYVGGFFTAVDDRVSARLATWSRACTCAPIGYCTAGTTANGCTAHVTASGTASASAGSGFDLAVTGVEGQRNGLIFYGTSGPLAVPWYSSTSYLCVKSPTQRTATQFSGGTNGACDGSFALDFNAYLSTHPAALGQPFTAVTSAWAQAWFRDPSSPNGTSLSDALSFDVCP